MTRISRHEYFMEIAKLTAKRSTGNVKVGAVAIKNNRIIMSAYNGSPSGMKHCTDVGCYIINDHCERIIHAEKRKWDCPGWGNPTSNGDAIECDFGGHVWGLRQEHLKYMWYEKPLRYDNCEDMQISFNCFNRYFRGRIFLRQIVFNHDFNVFIIYCDISSIDSLNYIPYF